MDFKNKIILINKDIAINALREEFKKVPTIAIRAMETIKKLPPAQPEQRWILCSERLPEEDNWLGGSGRQFSDEVLVSVANCNDEDIWTDISQTINGEWVLELPSHCKIIAWMSLPEPYAERRKE